MRLDTASAHLTHCRVKTLVLDLDDLLVHKEWTRQSGWKIFKRPGVQVGGDDAARANHAHQA